MKKIVSIMLITLVSVMTLSGKTKTPNHLLLGGEHLNDKNINYRVFCKNKQGELVLVEKSRSRKFYLLELNVGETYLIAFKNRKGEQKLLVINALKSGSFAVDVDWSTSDNAKVTVENNNYKIVLIKNKTELESVAQN